MKKIISILIMLLSSLTIKVKAETFSDVINAGGNMLPGEYVVKQKNGIRNYQTMNIITRRSDGQFVYCIEPDIFVSELMINGYSHNQANYANLSKETWDRISMLAYYGYGYKEGEIDHTDQKWYVVTQFMIWQSVPTEQDIFFTDYLNGNRITKYSEEMTEMENILLTHQTLPKFTNTNIKLKLGEKATFTDLNKVMESYTTTSKKELSLQRKGNSFTITGGKIGKYEITLFKTYNKYGTPPIVYVDPNTQNVLFRGDLDKNETKIIVEVTGGSLTIHKTGEKIIYENNGYHYDKINLENVKFSIFANEDIYAGNELIYKKDSLIQSNTTNENGNGKINNLYIGKYYLIEDESSEGNLKDDTKHFFEITSEKPDSHLELENFLPKGNIEIIKKDAKSGKALPDTKIAIYNCDNSLIYNGTTNKNGKINVENLLIGKYYLKEIEAPKGYVLNNDIIDFEITNNRDSVTIELENKQIEIPKKIEIITNVPDTGIKDNYISYTMGTIIVFSGIFIIIKDKKSKKISGSLFILLGSILLASKPISDYSLKVSNTIKRKEYLGDIPTLMVNKQNNYLGLIEIPSIKLFEGFNYDNIMKNVVILGGSSMPNENNGNLILAAHSGSGKSAFFKNLNKLEKNDTIYIYYQNQKYKYVIDDIYEIEKTGTAEIRRNEDHKTLTLITCKEKENKQIVLIAYQHTEI